MAIYYLDVKPIGGNSCRTAVGASAYRAGEKLYNQNDGITHDYTNRRGAVGAAAYRSSDKLHDGSVTHDFTQKGGIVYSEIILPKYAPEKYQIRPILWNSAEKAERNCNARTAREVVVALPNELSTEQQIKLVRDYVQRNFVDDGMCADFSIHSGHIHEKKGEIYPFQDLTVRKDNPHAHIQLTVRPINIDGTWGAKSKKEYILDKNGDKIKLPSGNWKSRKIDNTDWDKVETLLKWREDWAVTVNKEFERLGIDERISHLSLKEQGIDREPTKHMGHEAWNLEKKGIKTKIGNDNRAIMVRNKALEQHIPTAEYMHELKEGHFLLNKEISTIKLESEKVQQEIQVFKAQMEDMDERTQYIYSLKNRLEELKTKRQGMGFFTSKKIVDEEIQKIKKSHEQAENFFKQKYQIATDEAMAKLEQLKNNVKDMERVQERLQDRLTTLVEDREVFALEYKRQKLLAEISHDWQKIQEELIKLDKATRSEGQSVQDDIARTRSERNLDEVTEENLKETLKEMRPEQIKALTAHWEHEKEHKRERERVREYERGRF